MASYWTRPDYTSTFSQGARQQNLNKLENLQSIKVVITDDKSKWSRCVVLEAQDNPVFAEEMLRNVI